jgi:hypothetical protein
MTQNNNQTSLEVKNNERESIVPSTAFITWSSIFEQCHLDFSRII